ncbi:rhamnosyltransferase WsaF family glycosyltransferase [Paracraurococcus lichenis]|uniref:Class I SAM-dependent methyltransferase n=1 Tax=Paracraurococcus lichenis TaxID=3064888 RepID=A0ABT9DSN8_9PROT|nr:class I SAM-dependent methyltransferase [Paracraurococcus sp. LOR1-02]MDO9706893.1 class I SAM-dependent methyltransferase [Paracraurococcus sp. LOR1-02]
MDMTLPPVDASDQHRMDLALRGLAIGPEVDWMPDPQPPAVWHEHLPFAFWLVRALRPRSILELGAPAGIPYAVFCQAVERLGLPTRCYALGRGGDATGRLRDAAPRPDAPGPGGHGFSTLIQLAPEEARAQFEPGELDLLHLGGLRDEEGAAAAFRTWRDALSDRGVVLFDDTNLRERRFGVWRLWRELRAAHPHFEFLHGQGLGVLGLGTALPEPLRRLFAASAEAEDAFAIRRFFAARGAAVRDRLQLRALQARWAEAEETAFADRGAALAERDEARGRADRAAAERDRFAAECAALRSERDAMQGEMRHARALQDAMLRSTSWRITRPMRIAIGLARREPAYVARLKHALGRAAPVAGALPAPAVPLLEALLPGTAAAAPDALAYVAAKLPAPMVTFPETAAPRRLTLVTDSINAGHLFGGVGTAVVLAALLARRMAVPLRVVTRTEAPEPRNFGTVLAAHGIRHDANVEFLHGGNGRGVPMGAEDLVLTTSWWSTWAALRAVRPDRILYLLQEDERMFYPAGDEQLRCREVLDDTRVRFIVNTAALRDHLIAEGVRGVAHDSVAFEPAFPERIYHRERQPAREKRRFFFYARPNNDRNLFLRGLEAVSAAIEQGVLPAREWSYHFVGKDVPRILLPGGIEPEVSQNLPWASYAALIRSIDVGLSLMFTPHPSYPPLDLAASGAVVVTNRFGPKVTLDQYCRNILCAESSVEALVAALGEAARLARDEPQREANFKAARIDRDWEAAFAPVLDHLTA